MKVSSAATRLLSALLEARTGQELANSRSWRIETALGPVMREHGIETLDQLVGRLAGSRNKVLADEVVEALLNNETFFYRDRTAFDLLLGPALSRLERLRGREKRLSVWCAGCSTGQEAYSLAMTFAEQKLRWRDWRIDILATDVSHSAIERAKAGVYTQFEVQRGLPVLQMMRWFAERSGAAWGLSPEIRNAARFKVHNLVDPPPGPGRFDIILCRNVLLYFPDPVRRTVFANLASAAAEDGVLLLGAGETVIGHTRAFVSDPDCRGLYIRAPEERRLAAAAP